MTSEFVALLQAQNAYNQLWSQVMLPRQSEAKLQKLAREMQEAMGDCQKAFDAWQKAAAIPATV